MTDRDFEAEIAHGMVAGDVAAVGRIAMILAGMLRTETEKARKRRDREAEKKRRQRLNVPGKSGDTAGTCGDTTVQSGTCGDPPSPSPSLSSPTPLLNPSSPPSPASSSSADQPAGNVENFRTNAELLLAARLDTDGDRLALATVLGAAPFRQGWQAECDAALAGMHAPPLTALQLGAVLRDYVGNGHHQRPNFKHFRAYLRNPDVLAKAASAADPSPRTAGASSTDDATIALSKIRDLVQISDATGNGKRRFIRKSDVEELGLDVARAYATIGGADRILGCQPEAMGFLVRDFAAALRAARSD